MTKVVEIVVAGPQGPPGSIGSITAVELKTKYESNPDTNAYTDADLTKVAGIEAGATTDQTDAEIKTAYENNSNTNVFTNAQVTDLSLAIPSTDKGINNGVASLDSNALVPVGQLPSSVFDVLEFEQLSTFPATGEVGKLYIDQDTDLIHRWNGTVYVLIAFIPAIDKVLLLAQTSAEFFALAEKRIRDNAGSGFSEWGKYAENGTTTFAVNEGIWTNNTIVNLLRLGRKSTPLGISRSDVPIIEVNGVSLTVDNVNNSNTSNSNDLTFPDAPNGLKTYDTATGTLVTHADSATAFATETSTNKVVVSRQDLVFLESWHEKILDKDVVYPLGNVQYGASTYEGIALITSIVAQGYSAFGEWDTSTTGRGVVWSTMSPVNQFIFINDLDNNIYFDGTDLIQVRYRIRVVEGLGDSWDKVLPWSSVDARFANTSSGYLRPRGSLTTVLDLASFQGSNSFNGVLSGNFLGEGDVGAFTTKEDFANAHNGLCFAVPIALVERRNQGALEPTFNPNGTAKFGDGLTWDQTTDARSSTLDCFTSVGDGSISGANSGRIDDKFYDAIFASDVKDLRMSSRRLPVSEIREDAKRKAIAGEVRGFEGIPFSDSFVIDGVTVGGHGGGARIPDTFVLGVSSYTSETQVRGYGLNTTTGLSYPMEHVLSSGGDLFFTMTGAPSSTGGHVWQMVFGEVRNHLQANPSWTDIIGDPANIAATFPDGVEGQWIPIIPDGSSKDWPLNRKSISSIANEEKTVDDGVTWVSGTKAIDSIGNDINSQTIAVGRITLWHYETQAHFTEDDDNSEVLDLDLSVWSANMNLINLGGLLTSSLIGKIPTDNSYNQPVSTVTGIEYSTNKLSVSSNTQRQSAHITIDIDGTSTPALKTLDYLSESNGVGKLVYAYKEMIFDVDFGDNNKFEIANDQNTLTDDNGNTVLYGTASFDTQYFIERSSGAL